MTAFGAIGRMRHFTTLRSLKRHASTWSAEPAHGAKRRGGIHFGAAHSRGRKPRKLDERKRGAEARAPDWDFTNWCYASGHDASDPDARHLFECLLAYARREVRAGLH
jgi:hypothetical protein